MAVIYPLVQRVELTFVSVQGLNTVVWLQKSQLSKLLCDMQVPTNVEGPMTAQDHAHLFPPALEEQAHVSEFFFYSSYFVSRLKTASRSHRGGWNDSADGA